MSTRLYDIPVLRSSIAMIDSKRYNNIRLGMKRLANPLRIPLAGLRDLELIIEDEAWVCVDKSLNDMPVLAWLRFRPQERTALHQPVRCELRFFHAHAGVIVNKVLDIVDDYIKGNLPKSKDSKSEKVTPFPKGDDD